MNCEEVKPQIEAYALGALSSEEMSNIEKHLKTCEDCNAALEEYNFTLDSLALEAGARNDIFELREGHKERFMTRLKERPQLRPGSKSVEEIAADQALPKEVAVPKLKGRSGGWAWGSGVAALGFGLMALLMFGMGLWAWNLDSQLSQQRNQNSTLAAQLEQQRQQNQQLQSQQSNQSSELVTLRRQNEQLLNEKLSISQEAQQNRQQVESLQNVMVLLNHPQATTREAIKDNLRLKVLMAPDEKKVALLTHSWPKLSQNETYFVWLHKGDQIVPGGVLNLIALPDPATAEALIVAPEPMSNYTAVSVTVQDKNNLNSQRGREIIRDVL